MKKVLGWLALAALLAVGGWQGWRWWQHRDKPATATVHDDGYGSDDQPKLGNSADIVTVDEASATDPNQGATPMAKRSAVVGLLNKRNGQSRDLTLKVGQAVRVGDVIVRLRACERTAPWEQEQLTGAFVQLDVRQLDNSWRRVFSGWLYKERPALNVVSHPVYDVWTKSCTMSFPNTGPADAPSPAASGSARPRPAPSASSAPNLPTPAPATPPVAEPSPKASDSND